MTTPLETSKAHLEACLGAAKIERDLAEQKVKMLEKLISHGVEPAAAASAGGGEGEAFKPRKKVRVFLDADGNVIKKAMSGYNMYMTEMMKEMGKDGEKPKFGEVAASWKEISDADKEEWAVRAKAAVPKAVREEWIDEAALPRKKKRKKRDKSGYNLYVAALMKVKDNTKTIQEVAALWKKLPQEIREDWNKQAKTETERDKDGDEPAPAKSPSPKKKRASVSSKKAKEPPKKKVAAKKTPTKAKAKTPAKKTPAKRKRR